jgi:hypothetical protein
MEGLEMRHREISYIAWFEDYCRNSLLRAELEMKYNDRLGSLPPGYQVCSELEEDPETCSLIHGGLLELPFRFNMLPLAVWYGKGWFQDDPGMTVELLIGEFYGTPKAMPLGLREGKSWKYKPLGLWEGLGIRPAE